MCGRGFNDLKRLAQDMQKRQRGKRMKAESRAGGQSGAEIMAMFAHVKGVEIEDVEDAGDEDEVL